MKLLVSFCNQYGNAEASNLSFIDTGTKQVKEIAISVENMGIHGLAVDGNLLAAVYRSDSPGVVLLDAESFTEIGSFVLPELADPHGVAFLDGDFIITSTGNDQVIRYHYDEEAGKVECLGTVWSPEGSDQTTDTHHINSISCFKNNLYVSGFGPKKGELWSSADDGYVFNISEGKKELTGIYHPHSLSVTADGFFYCDSSRRRVMREKDELIKQAAGYTRGLSVSGTHLAVGSSNGRTKSKSTNASGEEYTGNIADPGILQQCCKVSIYENKQGYDFVEEYDFTGKRNEVFDVLILKD